MTNLQKKLGILQFLTTELLVAGKSFCKSYSSNCPVIVTDGDGNRHGACWHHLENGVCSVHGKVYDIPAHECVMTPELALAVTKVDKKDVDSNMWEDDFGPFYFDNQHFRDVYHARRDRHWPVAEAFNVDISEGHSMTGKHIIIDSDDLAVEFTVKSVHRHWYFGSYEILIAENKHGSSCVLFWKNISLFCEWMREQVRKDRKSIKIMKS